MSRTEKIRRVRFDRWGYIFVTPFFVAFLLFQLYPIINTFYLGFTNMKGASLEHQMVGMANFARSTESLKLEGQTADQANALVAALKEAGIDGNTDAPAADAGTSAFDLGTDAAQADAPADAFSLDAAPAAATGFSVQVTQMDDTTTATVRVAPAAGSASAACSARPATRPWA